MAFEGRVKQSVRHYVLYKLGEGEDKDVLKNMIGCGSLKDGQRIVCELYELTILEERNLVKEMTLT